MALPRNRAQRDDEAYKENAIDQGVDRRVCVMNGAANPVPVEIVEDGSGGDVTNVYNDISAVATASLTDIISYTVPVGKTLFLKEVEVSGDSLAEFTVEFDSVINAKKRSWRTHFNEEFRFYNLKLIAGTVVKVRVEHCSATAGDFEARIIGNLL